LLAVSIARRKFAVCRRCWHPRVIFACRRAALCSASCCWTYLKPSRGDDGVWFVVSSICVGRMHVPCQWPTRSPVCQGASPADVTLPALAERVFLPYPSPLSNSHVRMRGRKERWERVSIALFTDTRETIVALVHRPSTAKRIAVFAHGKKNDAPEGEGRLRR